MALSISICIPSFSTLDDFASAAIRAASLKFLAAAATFFSASSSGTLLSMKIIRCLKDVISCLMFDFLEDSS
jgi:hypothetical protein